MLPDCDIISRNTHNVPDIAGTVGQRHSIRQTIDAAHAVGEISVYNAVCNLTENRSVNLQNVNTFTEHKIFNIRRQNQYVKNRI